MSSKILHEVQAHQPMSLMQAMAFSKLQEDKVNDQHCSSCAPSHVVSAPSPSTLLSLSTPPKAPFKDISPKEIAYCCDHGFCYYNDEKFHIDHHCKGRLLLLLSDDVEGIPDLTQIPLIDIPSFDPIAACRPWIFFINGVLCFLKINGSGMDRM